MCSQIQVLTSKFGPNYELIELFGEQHFIPKIVVWRRGITIKWIKVSF